MTQEQLEILAIEAYREWKEGNISYWIMPEDSEEVRLWKDVFIIGYKNALKTKNDNNLI